MADRTRPEQAPVIDPAAVEEILGTAGRERKDVIAVLRAVQERYRHLPEAALRRVVESSRLTPADIEGVSTFYSQFRKTPCGRHRIRVCLGTACFVKGGEDIHEAFRAALKIRPGEDTDGDELFTVEKVACLGCCTIAPVAQIDETVYGNLTRQKVPSVLGDFLAAGTGAGEEQDAFVQAAEGSGSKGRGRVSLCTCTSCRAAGAGEVREAFRREARAYRLAVDVRGAACTGISYRAPVAEVLTREGGTVRYAEVRPADARDILFRHFRAATAAGEARRAASRLLDRLLSSGEREPVSSLALDLARGPDGAFWGPQVRIVTAMAEQGDPLDIGEYRAAGGFEALRSCLAEMSPPEVIERVRQSGLRGRGGGGYPAAPKWEEVRSSPGETKYLICNADEGDPGAFMDRMTLESFPFRVIEGMAIAAYATGARRGMFFVRTEYPLAIARIRRAREICAGAGILGERVMGFPFSLEMTVVESAGAFVCGEETAMIAALEGRRGNPRARPPYPSRQGLWGCPTLVNNVETFATVPWIIANGPEAFRALGTAASPGTKTFALAGKIRRGGLIEVPMGISLRRIVEEIGGGMQEGNRLKAVQVGGPSGGCIPESMADLRVDFESLSAAGAMMGSGGMVVLDESDCMVDVARYFMSFAQRESCGKCTCCRVGTKRMLDLLSRLCAGKGRPGDIGLLERLAAALKEGSLCGLGRSAPNPVLSTLRYFRGEYEEHIAGTCPAGKCKALIAYWITEECIGCTRCAQRCPASAIEARPYERHVIDETRCIRCGTCRQVCPSEAVKIVRKGTARA